ncbi:hypothetical protein HGRIS_012085 [Hohenbuehelia grisea]|uniref:Uncharacterized protein n=1 Tax=Hohenbuehelia grisea TaxID=104357 RepID=A0ABR3IR84_9AGAR
MTRSNQSPRAPKLVKKTAKKVLKAQGISVKAAPQSVPEPFRVALFPNSAYLGDPRFCATCSRPSNADARSRGGVVLTKACWRCEPPENKPKEAKSANAGTTRRNPGRMDGRMWNGASFMCPLKVDDEDLSEDDEGGLPDWCDYEPPVETEPHVIELLDIAREAKPKGVAKEFEVVSPLDRVIVLEDGWQCDWQSESESDGDNEALDGWDELYDEFPSLPRTSYSSVVKGKERDR